MKQPSYRDVEQLLIEIVMPFYQIERDIHVPIRKRFGENDAEHSWSVAFLACALAERIDKRLDPGKISQFAIVHDLVEVFAGDTSVWGKPADIESKPKREKLAFQKLKRDYKQFPWIAKVIDAYEQQNMAEARFVKSVDKYIAIFFLQLGDGEFYQHHKITKQRFINALEPHRRKAQGHVGVAKYYDELRAKMENRKNYFYKSKAQTKGRK